MKNLESWTKWRVKIFLFGIPLFFISLSILKKLLNVILYFLGGSKI